MSQPMFEGAFVAIATPLRNGEVDLAALRGLIDYLLEGGINGLVPCGTTGEAATLDAQERDRVIRATIEHVAGRVPVVAGVGTNSTRATIDNARRAQELGADALLVVAPYYNKPNQEGLYQHFTAVADAVPLPQIVYNVPGRTCCKIEVPTLARLSRHPHIVATKDATADMVFAAETLAACQPGFGLLTGDDGTTLPFLAVGGHGCISVVGNVAPRLMSDLYRAAAENRWDAARQLNQRMVPLFRALFADTNPIPVKAALSLMGLVQHELRLPLVPAESWLLDKLGAALREAGLLS